MKSKDLLNEPESRIYRRDCGHVIVRKSNASGKVDNAKLVGTSLRDSIAIKEDCHECLRLKIESKKKPSDPLEARYVNSIKNQNAERVVAIPRARLNAVIDIKESHTDERGVRVIDRAELVAISLIPDHHFGKLKVHKPKKSKK